ncbi:hypothetical protein LG634_17200 [Streptomyces bambusae]|uniref:hypothetical protein n=1 Tax=Streptomyces bambusae TaxID=1550616 RepID=UPI001CFD718B|nr:hypothetical protein [Streptomyces bambusae]MCB5166567.1 hypothetical protein [Streptomyces bambusae]
MVVEDWRLGEYVPLEAGVILTFHELCLVEAEGEWFMGRTEADGTVICWASYGSDLGEAIRGL